MSDFNQNEVIKAEEVSKLNHADELGEHGIATNDQYGHVKLSTDYTATDSAGIATTPYALSQALANLPEPVIPEASPTDVGGLFSNSHELFFFSNGVNESTIWPNVGSEWVRYRQQQIPISLGVDGLNMIDRHKNSEQKVFYQFLSNSLATYEDFISYAPVSGTMKIRYLVDADSSQYLRINGEVIGYGTATSTSSTSLTRDEIYSSLITYEGAFVLAAGDRFRVRFYSKNSTLSYGTNSGYIEFIFTPDVPSLVLSDNKIAVTKEQLLNYLKIIRYWGQEFLSFDWGTYSGDDSEDGEDNSQTITTSLNNINFLLIVPLGEAISNSRLPYDSWFYPKYYNSSYYENYQNTAMFVGSSPAGEDKTITLEGEPYVTIHPGGAFTVHNIVEGTWISANKSVIKAGVNHYGNKYMWIAGGEIYDLNALNGRGV